MKILWLLLLILLLLKDTFAILSDHTADQIWQDASESSNSTNSTTPEIIVLDDDEAGYSPTNPGDAAEAPAPTYQFLPLTRSPSHCHPFDGSSNAPSGNLNAPIDSNSLHPSSFTRSFVFIDPLKAMNYFIDLLKWHRTLEQFLPRQFNYWRRRTHRDFSSFMTSYEQQIVVNNLRHNPMGSLILRLMKLMGMVAGYQIEDMSLQLQELHYVDTVSEQSDTRPVGQSYMEQLVSTTSNLVHCTHAQFAY